MKKNINKQIFKELFFYIPLFIAKELCQSNQNINDEIVNHINGVFIELKKYLMEKRFLEMKMEVKI